MHISFAFYFGIRLRINAPILSLKWMFISRLLRCWGPKHKEINLREATFDKKRHAMSLNSILDLNLKFLSILSFCIFLPFVFCYAFELFFNWWVHSYLFILVVMPFEYIYPLSFTKQENNNIAWFWLWLDLKGKGI